MNDEPTIENLESARFECVYPTCGGICCKNGRPAVETDEATGIERQLGVLLPMLSESARARIERDGFLTRRKKEGLPMLATQGGWCVFFNQGCTLHKLGAAEGDAFLYKPWRCAVFPLERNATTRRWHVRQHGVHGEAWELFCLDPKESPKSASTTLRAEVEQVRALEPKLRRRER